MKSFIILCLILAPKMICGQPPFSNEERILAITQSLNDYAKKHKSINETITISATANLKDLTLAIAQETKLNLTIDPSINQQINYNFTEVPAKDILIYLCQQYNLELRYSGSIISLVPYAKPVVPVKAKVVGVEWNAYNNSLQIDLKNDTLGEVLKRISQATGKNVVSTKEVSAQIVNGFIGKTTFDNAIEQMAVMNELGIQKTGKDYYILGKKNADPKANPLNGNKEASSPDIPQGLTVTVVDSADGRKFINITAIEVPANEILKVVSSKLGKNYFINSLDNSSRAQVGGSPQGFGGGQSQQAGTGTLSMKLTGVSYESFLDYLFTGTSNTYKLENDIYLIGSRMMEELRATETYQFKHRSSSKIEEKIPQALKQDVNIIPFDEINALVLSGSKPVINELKEFLENIDKPIPIVNIELLIIDVNKGRTTQTGIQAGTGTPPSTSQTLFPGVDFTFSSSAINDLLRVLTGNGIINLGQVTDKFYLTLKMVESTNLVKVHSKPQLSTLNSHEASFTIGQTKNYLQENAVVQGGVNPVTVQGRTAQSAEANFTIKITPFVAGDENVTLDIDVDQSRFLGASTPNLPPDKTSRKFKSLVRVANGDMIALGGLEDITIQDSREGVPILSRIPIINWFFSKKQRGRSKTQLLIFIKANVYY